MIPLNANKLLVRAKLVDKKPKKKKKEYCYFLFSPCMFVDYSCLCLVGIVKQMHFCVMLDFLLASKEIVAKLGIKQGYGHVT